MKINVVERHHSSSKSLKEYAIKKTETLDRYFNRVMSIDITLSVEKERQSADFVVHLINRKVIKAREESEDMYAAIDRGINKLKRQLVKYKDKVKDKGTGSELQQKDEAVDVSTDLSALIQEQERKEIIRTDHFIRKPMLPEEAALQLATTDQIFLVFMNATSGTPNVIYQRKDGNYGLIEP
ncbi:ribosome-associated translation inhibitor RaiA [Candidatus Bipolaricaulota bacterium]|nr:ribosome-associated translation inhibitor RaiA [Candidatus Bipolaricaulota bacterium]